MTDYYTTADLKDRGWTDGVIKQHLGESDGSRANPNAVHRVHELESGKARAKLEKISDARELAWRAHNGREKLFAKHWIIH